MVKPILVCTTLAGVTAGGVILARHAGNERKTLLATRHAALACNEREPNAILSIAEVSEKAGNNYDYSSLLAYRKRVPKQLLHQLANGTDSTDCKAVVETAFKSELGRDIIMRNMKSLYLGENGLLTIWGEDDNGHRFSCPTVLHKNTVIIKRKGKDKCTEKYFATAYQRNHIEKFKLNEHPCFRSACDDQSELAVYGKKKN